uniref:Uncharacterized protein n=1 Tax=Biomphalaria glabrata TaxID=6526 RepID=A0A2C9KS34_BIOGL
MLLTVVILIVCVDNDEFADEESFMSGTGEATSLLEAPDDKFRDETETAAITQAEDVITVASDENLRHNIGDANISPLIPERTCVPSVDPDQLPKDASSSGMMGTRIEELMVSIQRYV